jgi:mono/diheme cytochrome c family protein
MVVRLIPLWGAALLGTAAPAEAQSSLAGKRLYLDAGSLRDTGVSCVDCHGGYPPGLFGIGRAANLPAAVEAAVNTIPQMEPLRGRLGAADYADLAAYLGDPSVPSPQVRVRLAGGTGSPLSLLDFGEVAPGAEAVRTVLFENAGTVSLQVLTTWVIDGTDAGDFSLRDETCAATAALAPGASCQVAIGFAPRSGPGRRSARARIEHDWVRSPAALALRGDAAAPDATDPDPTDRDRAGGCAVIEPGGAERGIRAVVMLGSLTLLALRRPGRRRARSRHTLRQRAPRA